MRMKGKRIHKKKHKKLTGNRKCNGDNQLCISLCHCDYSYPALFLRKFPNIYNICINKLQSVKKIEIFSYISQCFQKKQNLQDRYIEMNTQRCIYIYIYKFMIMDAFLCFERVRLPTICKLEAQEIQWQREPDNVML